MAKYLSLSGMSSHHGKMCFTSTDDAKFEVEVVNQGLLLSLICNVDRVRILKATVTSKTIFRAFLNLLGGNVACVFEDPLISANISYSLDDETKTISLTEGEKESHFEPLKTVISEFKNHDVLNVVIKHNFMSMVDGWY